MSDKTAIEWTDDTWNPVRGCSRVSEGCRNCYAERVAARFCGPGQPYEGLARNAHPLGWVGPRWTGEVRMVPEKLDQPLRWKKPRRVFVNSMSDLFHEKLTDEEIAAVFGVMAAAQQRTFQVLTKRPERMRAWFEWLTGKIEQSRAVFPDDPAGWIARHLVTNRARHFGARAVQPSGDEWPLPNVWLGVSIEDQQTADERIPLLLQTPAAVRFVSCEPLLGPIDFRKATGILALDDCQRCTDWRGNHIPTCQEPFCDCKSFVPGISWVIVGGESGPGARPTDVAWIRSIVEQCRDAGTACFVKQLGARPAYGLDVAPLPAPQSAESIMRHGEYDPEPDWLSLRDRKGGDPAEWPADLRVREFPHATREPAAQAKEGE